MKNSCPVILSSVLLSFFVSISGGVQGQSFGTCILSSTEEFIDGETNAYSNSQTIYSILCEKRFDADDELNPNFTTLCTLLNSGTQSEVKNLLDNPSARITFFAPADTAFVGVGTAGLTPDQIKAVLQTHILPNPILLKDLTCDKCFCTAEGGITNPCRTKTRTVCRGAGTTFQVGGGNTGVGGVQEFPQIGQPLGPTQAFYQGFGYTEDDDFSIPSWGIGNENIIQGNNQGYFSVDAVACNGIIHAVNKLILPGVGVNRNPQCGTTPGGKGSKGGKGSAYYYGGKGSGYYNGKGAKGYGGYFNGFEEEVIIVNGNGRGFVEFVGYGRKGNKGYYNRRELDMEDTFFEEGDEEEEEEEDEDEVEDEVADEEEDSSVVPPQDHDKGSSSSSSSSSLEERSQRRRRLLESLIGPEGEIEQLE